MRDVSTPRALTNGAGRIALAGAVAAGLAGTLAGCGTSQAKVTLPDKPMHLTVVATPPARPSARQRVLDAYRGYWAATSRAVDSRSPARARAILASYIPSGAIGGLISGLRSLWRHDEMSYGWPVLHIISVTISPRGTATVHDCVDMSHAGLVDARTGQIVG